MSEYIEVGQPLQFTDPNTPTRVGEIVENVSDIYNIPSPRLGMQVFVKSEKKSFVITSLKSKVIGGVDVPEAAVEAFEPVGAKSIIWNNDNAPSNMNDFVEAGIYEIRGERTRIDDNLPFGNTGSGHTFHARLEVLDSSIAPGGQSDDICITQKLTLSNRVAGDGDVYIRTGRGTSKEAITWETWGMLQQNIEVGSVPTLDNLVDNGIYSGVWVNGHLNNYPLTFVCIVINDYFIGTSPRRISQFLYGLSKFDGSTHYQTRVWDDSKDKWSDWEILNHKEIASMIKSSVDNAIKGIIADAPEAFDTLKEIADWIANDETGAVALANSISANTKAINTEVTRAKATEEVIKSRAIDADSLNVAQEIDEVRIDFDTLDDGAHSGEIIIPAATTESAGMMSAEDKVNMKDLLKKNALWQHSIDELNSAKQNVANVPWAISRAPIDISNGVITIGVGYIYIWVNNKEYIYSYSASKSYDLKSNKALVYNTQTNTISVVQRSAIDSTIMLPLFIHDGGSSIIIGLLRQQELNNLNTLFDYADNFKHNKIDCCSRAKIKYENKTLTIGTGSIYFSCGKYFIVRNNPEEYQYTFSGSRSVVYDTIEKMFVDKDIQQLLTTDILMLWYDGVKGVDGGLLLKYIKQTEYADKIATIESKISEKGVSLFKADLDDSIKPIMHGGTNVYPQNNLELYRLAGRNGVLFWECDVRPCLDGFVLSHDDDMYQLAVADDGSAINQGDFVCSQKTIAELKTLKVGVKKGTTSLVSGFEDERIPTLEEFLTLCKIYGACPVLELKFYAPSRAEDLYNIVKKMGMLNKTIWLLYSGRNEWGNALHTLDDRNNIVYCGDTSLPTSDIDEIISFKTEKNIVGLYYYITTLTDEIIERALTNEVMVGTWSGTSINNWSSLLQKGYSMFSLDNPASNPLIELR